MRIIQIHVLERTYQSVFLASRVTSLEDLRYPVPIVAKFA